MFQKVAAIAGVMLCVFSVSAREMPLPPMPVAQSLPVQVKMDQQEILVDEDDGTRAASGSGGLLGLLVMAGVSNVQAKNSNRGVGGIRDELIDYPFASKLEAALNEHLRSESLSPDPQISFVSPSTADGPPPTLLISPRFAFDHEFKKLYVELQAVLTNPGEVIGQRIRLGDRWTRRYEYNFALAEPADEIDDDAATWAAFGGDRLKQMLDRAIEQSVELMVYDFSPKGRAEATAYVYKRRASVHIKDRDFYGVAVQQGDGWVWSRYGAGVEQSLQGYETVAKP